MANLWQNFLINAKREKLITLANLLVMFITFLILGLFISVTVLSQTALRALEEQAQLTVFFKDDFTEANIMSLKNELEGDSRVLDINYVSKDQAFKLFTDLNRDQPELLDSVSKNILPASLEIKTRRISDMNPLSEELSGKDGVEEVKFFKDIIEKFKLWSRVVYAVGFTLALLFLVVSYSIIVLTLRMTIHSKGTELEIMKLVGASNDFIRKPLMLQGVFFGLISSVSSSILLVVILVIARSTNIMPSYLGLAILPGVRFSFIAYLIFISLMLIISGLSLGYLGSLSAIKKYLKY